MRYNIPRFMSLRLLLSLLVCAVLLTALRAQETDMPADDDKVWDEIDLLPDDDEEAMRPAVIRYRDPVRAMFNRRTEAVSIEISPKWNLTEAQMETALREPRVKEGVSPRRYIYPEDVAPTEEEKAAGSALTPAQRAGMKRARKLALQEACWQAYLAAERYNKEHDEVITRMEKQGLHIIINLAKQQGQLMEGETLVLQFNVCTGRKSKPTPTGHFHVLDKDRNHRSNLYNNASMPFFLRLTMGGVGLHQGHLAGYPASHGCIRLSEKTARFLFDRCEVGTPVFVQ